MVAKSKVISFSILSLLTFVAYLRPVGLDADSVSYSEYFRFLNTYSVLSKEPTLWIVSSFAKAIGADVSFVFLIYSVIASLFLYLSLELVGFARYRAFLFFYICLFFIVHYLTQIRAGAAAAILWYASIRYFQGDRRGFYLFGFTACVFHFSALFGIMMTLATKAKFRFVLLGSVCALFLGTYLNSENITKIASLILPGRLSSVVEMYSALIQDSKKTINIFYVFVAFCLVGWLCFYRRQIIVKPLLLGFTKLSFLSFSVFVAFRNFPVIAFRLSEIILISFCFLLAHISETMRPRLVPVFLLYIPVIIYSIKTQVLSLNFQGL